MNSFHFASLPHEKRFKWQSRNLTDLTITLSKPKVNLTNDINA
ncbi:MAG: hypothetical protein ACTS4Y_00770 [Candidatus Hodgkinia cicadicola]